MKSTPDLCDEYPELVSVVEPIFSNFGGRECFSGQIVTVKCFEDNSVVKQLVGTKGNGRVVVVDAGGSMRRACLGDMLAEQASANGWSGIIMFGCIRDVDYEDGGGIGWGGCAVRPCSPCVAWMGL